MLNDMIIGGIAGVTSRTITAPLELYKMQRQNSFMPGSTLRFVVNEEGLRHLWKGNATNCTRVFPQTAINYAIYNLCENKFLISLKNDNTRSFFSGVIGGTISMIITYPLETLKTRLSLQCKSCHYNGIMDAFFKIPRTDLYKGLRMSIIGYAPFTAISFTLFPCYKKVLDQNLYNYSDFNRIIAGGMSGVSSIIVTYPTDLIRRRLQLQNFDSHVPKYYGIVDCTKRIIACEGLLGLYRGLFAACIKSFPTIGIQFLVIDNLKQKS